MIATKTGYFGKLREPGETFEVPDKSKASWFSPVKTEPSVKPKAKEAPDEPLA